MGKSNYVFDFLTHTESNREIAIGRGNENIEKKKRFENNKILERKV